MFQPDGQQKLVWGVVGENFKDPAEMKRAYKTVTGNFHQGDILREITGDIVFCFFHRSKVVALQPGIDTFVGLVIRDSTQYSGHHFHHQLVNMQFGSRSLLHQLQNKKMQKFCNMTGFQQGGVEIITPEK